MARKQLLQLYRNAEIYENLNAAKAALNSMNDLHDGEVIAVRYKAYDEQYVEGIGTLRSETVRTLLGVYAITEGMVMDSYLQLMKPPEEVETALRGGMVKRFTLNNGVVYAQMEDGTSKQVCAMPQYDIAYDEDNDRIFLTKDGSPVGGSGIATFATGPDDSGIGGWDPGIGGGIVDPGTGGVAGPTYGIDTSIFAKVSKIPGLVALLSQEIGIPRFEETSDVFSFVHPETTELSRDGVVVSVSEGDSMYFLYKVGDQLYGKWPGCEIYGRVISGEYGYYVSPDRQTIFYNTTKKMLCRCNGFGGCNDIIPDTIEFMEWMYTFLGPSIGGSFVSTLEDMPLDYRLVIANVDESHEVTVDTSSAELIGGEEFHVIICANADVALGLGPGLASYTNINEVTLGTGDIAHLYLTHVGDYEFVARWELPTSSQPSMVNFNEIVTGVETTEITTDPEIFVDRGLYQVKYNSTMKQFLLYNNAPSSWAAPCYSSWPGCEAYGETLSDGRVVPYHNTLYVDSTGRLYRSSSANKQYTYLTEVGASKDTLSAVSASTNYNEGQTSVTSLTNFSTAKRFVFAELSSDQTVRPTNFITFGRELHIVVKTTSNAVTLTLDPAKITPFDGVTQLQVPSWSGAEINLLCAEVSGNATYFSRCAVAANVFPPPFVHTTDPEDDEPLL